MVSGKTINCLVPWNLECIKQDHGKSFLSSIHKYDGFCYVPMHLNYTRDIGNFYNRYQPFKHVPAEGIPVKTINFLEHLFEEQLEIALDYFKILLLYPTQILPVLALLSKERNTGKTTFLNYMKELFGDNMTINSNEDFQSNFNAEWAQKLIIAVDETLLEKKEESERIKALATSKYYKVEAKGVDRQEIEFYGKFIFCSNNEDNFIQIDPLEIRFWVRKLSVLNYENTNMQDELIAEIPFFIYHLIHREFKCPRTTRMWFTAEQLSTPALQRIMRFNKNKLESEMAELLLNILDIKDTIPEISFSLTDMQGWLQRKAIRGNDATQIRNVLQNNWKLTPTKNSFSYHQYRFGMDGFLLEGSQKGRYYSITKKQVLKYNNLDDTDDYSINK